MDKKLKILILEDIPADAELMEHELRRGGIAFTSKRVETREDFVNELKSSPPELILADFQTSVVRRYFRIVNCERRKP